MQFWGIDLKLVELSRYEQRMARLALDSLAA